MKTTRRHFLELGAAGLASGQFHSTSGPTSDLTLSPYALARYVDKLPIASVAAPQTRVPCPERAGAEIPYYRIVMKEFSAKVHRDIQPTRFWGYGGSLPGPTFETKSSEGLMVEWVNELPTRHLFPIDHTLHGAERDKPEVRTVVHVHGTRVPPESDGYPERWIVSGQRAIHYYPNHQEAATLFYHDHAMGITRLNAVAGLFGVFLIRDQLEASLNLPTGPCEMPLTICDRQFSLDGQLSYPTSGNPAAPWTSEFYGNTVLLNGKIFPYLEVEPRQYRFRIVNSSNAGFYQLSVARDDLNLIPGSEAFVQIGSDQGLLAAPVPLKSLLLTPGERADLIIDFSRWRESLVFKARDGFCHAVSNSRPGAYTRAASTSGDAQKGAAHAGAGGGTHA